MNAQRLNVANGTAQKNNLAIYQITMPQKAKKAQFFMPLMVVLTLIILTSLFIILVGKQGKFEHKVGEGQGAIMKAALRSQKAMLYIDLSAKIASDQALYDLAKTGGFYIYSDCGQKDGYNLWNSKDMECWPDNPEEQFEEYFRSVFSQYLLLYQDIDITRLNYILTFNGGYIYGFSLETLNTSIMNLVPQIALPNYEQGIVTILPTAQVQAPQRVGAKQGASYQKEGDSQRSGFSNQAFEAQTSGQYAWPGSNKVITSCFGTRDERLNPDLIVSSNLKQPSIDHKGIDIRARMLEPVYAIADGEAKVVGGTYNKIIIKHSDGLESVYLHNAAIGVTDGQKVKKGEMIARAGNTGSLYPHIHLEVIKNGKYIDPLDPENKIFNPADLNYSGKANCVYRAPQYSYASTIKKRVVT
ncbi:MAG: M23 family metallopeptidase [Candidatus Woesearchaeota archaeon]